MQKRWDIFMLGVSMFFLNRCSQRFKEAIEITIDKAKLANMG